MTETKNLTDEELKQVSGGTGEDGDTTGTINIQIRDMHGGTFYCTVSPETTIGDLKLMWAGEGHEVWAAHARMVYKGKELDNSGTIASYNIPNGAQIHVILS